MKTIFLLALVAVAALLAPDVWAAEAGRGEAQVFANILQSNVGLGIGLTVGAIGFWMWLMNQNSFGIIMIILGVAITAFPGMFVFVYEQFRPFVDATGGSGPAEIGWVVE